MRINWHVSPKDVGHHLIIAPTGMGKSFLLNLMVAQFRRYPGTQVFHLDNGYSGYALVKVAGGTHYDRCSGRPDAVAFSPGNSLLTQREGRVACCGARQRPPQVTEAKNNGCRVSQ